MGTEARIGIIGTEAADPWLLDALLDSSQNDLLVVGCWSPPGLGTDVSNGRRRGIRQLESLDDLIAAAECLYIAAPVTHRLHFARHAISGRKAVFCEQPLSEDPVETARFVREAQNAQVAVNYVTPGVPALDLLRTWLKWDVIGAPYRLDLTTDWIHAIAGTGQNSCQSFDSSNRFVPDLLIHHLFLARRLFGILRLQDAPVAVPYGLPPGTVPFRAGSIPSILLEDAIGAVVEADATWMLYGVGAIRLRGWSTLERATPDGRWSRETPHLAGHQVRTIAAAAQVKELAAFARNKPHHLATHFEAYEVEAFVSLLRWAQV